MSVSRALFRIVSATVLLAAAAHAQDVQPASAAVRPHAAPRWTYTLLVGMGVRRLAIADLERGYREHGFGREARRACSGGGFGFPEICADQPAYPSSEPNLGILFASARRPLAGAIAVEPFVALDRGLTTWGANDAGRVGASGSVQVGGVQLTHVTDRMRVGAGPALALETWSMVPQGAGTLRAGRAGLLADAAVRLSSRAPLFVRVQVSRYAACRVPIAPGLAVPVRYGGLLVGGSYELGGAASATPW